MTVSPIPVLHMITRLIVGGAQENTLFTAGLVDKNQYQVEILSGSQIGSEGSLIEEGRANGITITLLPELVRQVNPFLDSIALWKMVRYIRGRKFKIVHTHSSKAGILGRIAAKFAGVPSIIHTVHGWSFHDHMHPVSRYVYILLERFCARFTDALIVVTNRDQKKGLEAGIGKPSQYHLIRSAIPLEEFNPAHSNRDMIRQQLGLPIHAPVLGTVGRFSNQKNPLEWVKVAKIVSQEVSECRFLMVGDGPLRPQVESLLVEIGLKDKTILTGIRRDIPQMMSAMDVFLLTSRWEGLPRVIPQAMSMGLPVVATSVDGSTEVIEDGTNGFLCPSGDVNYLAERCLEILRNVELRQAFSQAGREAALRNFDLSQMISQIDALYNELLFRSHASTG